MKQRINKIVQWSLQITRGKRFFLVLGCITLLGLVLRGIACAQLWNSPTVQHPAITTDMATYRELALAVCRGELPAYFDYQPFYYTVFLPLLFFLTPSGSPVLPMLAQCLLGCGAIWLCGIVAAKLFGRRAGCTAAILLALSQFHIFYTPYLLLEVLQSFWMALILFWTLHTHQKNRITNWILLGLFCACSTLTRGNALLFMPGIFLLCGWKNAAKPKRAALLILLIAIAFYLPQLPYSLRNYQHYGSWKGPSVAQDKVLALGNTPEAPAGGLEYPRSYHEWCRLSEESDPALRKNVPQQMLHRLREDSLVYLEQKFRTFLLFWDKMEIPNNISIDYEGQYSNLIQSPFLLRFAVIGSLGLAGFLLCLRRLNCGKLCLLYAILTYCAGTIAFYMLARFRLGCVPLLCVAGAGALRVLLSSRAPSGETMRMRRQQGFLCLLFAVFIVNSAYSNYHQFIEPAFQRNFLPDGMQLAFPDQYVVYDHGPLTVGGTVFMPVENEWAIFEKEFVISPDKLAQAEGCPATVLLRLHATQPGQILRECEYESLKIVQSEIIADRMVTWVRFEIPAISPKDGKVRVRFRLKKLSGEYWITFDESRKYDRTFIKEPGQPLQPMPMELFAELEIALGRNP